MGNQLVSMKIVRTDSELQTPVIDSTLRQEGHELVLLSESVSEQQLCEAVRECDILLMCYTPVTKEVIGAAPKLKAIIKYGVGIDAIDISEARARGIVVVNVPEYAEETVAEGAFAMLIALAKKIPMLHNQMQKSGWAWPEQQWLGLDLSRKTIGIVGCGKIGANMARITAKGFGMRVLGYDPRKTHTELADCGIQKMDDLNGMLVQCDFISLHAVLNDETRYLIGAAQFSVMKPTVIFINSARGALVDELALLAALENKQIAGAGLDVYSKEPLNQTDHPLSKLFRMDNVLLFPHLTFYTREAMARLEEEVLERCAEVVAGKPVIIRSKDPRLQEQTGLVWYP